MAQKQPHARKSWFSNLFSFKPASFNLLSMYDMRVTRGECKRLLRSLGVVVILEDSEAVDGGVLKCRLDEVRGKFKEARMWSISNLYIFYMLDPSGVLAVIKAVRFRVEFHLGGVTSSHAAAGFKSSLSLIQEKGALSSFKLIFNRLRREWELDAPPAGILTGPTATRHPETLRLVIPSSEVRPRSVHSGSYASSTGTPSTRSTAFPSPALSAGGRLVDNHYQY